MQASRSAPFEVLSVKCRSLSVLSMLAAFAIAGSCWGDDGKLVGLLPEEANTISIIRVAEVLKSPRAQREQWAQAADEKFLSGSGGIPSWVETLVVGSLFRPVVSQEVWSAGIASVPDSVTAENMAARAGSTLEMIAGIPAVRDQRNSFLLLLEKGVVAVHRPAMRQETAAWLRQIQNHQTGPSSEFLRSAAQTPGHVIMAIDLADALDPARIRNRLESDTKLSIPAGDRGRVGELLSSLKGVTLIVTVNEAITSQVRFDFGKPVGSDGQTVKALFLDILGEQGAMIDDFATGRVESQGNSCVLKSTLSDESLRRVLSLITASPPVEQPSPPSPAVAGKPPEPSGSDAISVSTSRKYLQSVNRLVGDMERARSRDIGIDRTTVWHDNNARRISELSVRGVDPELVEYAARVSSQLRALSRSVRAQDKEVNVQQETFTYDVNYQPGWSSVNLWGGWGYQQPTVSVTSNLQQIREQQAATVIASASQREEVWHTIADERDQIARRMREKYGTDFVK